jgi:hypothetical protein
MNLVQINERLKDMPEQVIRQYANGMNPEVPPYLALGELQRRELSAKQMASTQGGAQGPQPSVKEQIEQKAGLMALQQMQQQQAQQAQPRGPMPAPAGVPQPEAQPQAPMMAARGGLASIPVRSDMFEYAGGGIIAFADGGQPKKYETHYDKMNRENREASTEKKPLDAEAQKALEDAQRSSDRGAMMGTIKKLAAAGYDIATLIPRAAMGVTEDLANTRLGRALGVDFQLPEAAYGGNRASMTPMLDRVSAAATEGASPVTRPNVTAETMKRVGAMTAPKFADPRMPAGLPGALAQAGPAATDRPAPPMPGGPRPPAAQRPDAAAPQAAPIPTDPQAGLPAAAQSVNPYEARLNQVALKEPIAPTTQDAISRVNELSPAAMREAALQKRNQEMRDRATGYKEQFEKSRPSGLDDLIRVFGQAGQYKGMSGMGPAYTANQQQKRAEELAMTRQYNELMNLADTKELEGNKELFKARTGAFDTAQQLFGKEKDQVVKATASLYETTQGRINNELKMLSDKEIQNLRMAQETKIKGMEIGQRERERTSLNARDPNAMVAQYVGLKAKARQLREDGKTAEADRLEAQAADMMTFKGGSGAGDENAATRSIRTALEAVNKRLELMGSDEPDYLTLKKQQKDLSDQLVGRALGSSASQSSKPITKAEYDKLPKGATYIAPDGTQRTKG